jgi:hypothetical protein
MFDPIIGSDLSRPPAGLMSGKVNPLALACFEISMSHDRAVNKYLRARYLSSLLRRSDRMLEGLEELNLIGIARVPEAWRFHMAALVADLPFEFSMVIKDRPSPTQAIDLVFELQETILLFMTGTKPDEDDLEEAAS